MVNIVVGEINQGKTTKLIKLYEEINKGDGFVSVKRMKENQVIGYDALWLSNRKKYTFILKEDRLPKDWDNIASLGSYRFSRKTLEMIEEKIDYMLKKGISPIFLDEIGLLELKGNGFDKILRKILAQNNEVYIAVRDKFINRVISKYSIKQKNIISLT